MYRHAVPRRKEKCRSPFRWYLWITSSRKITRLRGCLGGTNAVPPFPVSDTGADRGMRARWSVTEDPTMSAHDGTSLTVWALLPRGLMHDLQWKAKAARGKRPHSLPRDGGPDTESKARSPTYRETYNPNTRNVNAGGPILSFPHTRCIHERYDNVQRHRSPDDIHPC